MNIITYRVEKDAERHPFLVEENIFEYGKETVNNSQDAVELMNKVFRLRNLAEEHVCLLALDSKGSIIGLFDVSHGTINSSICNPREIFLRALVSGAASIIVVHNHPSGDTTPSDQDCVVYRRLSEAGKLLGIALSDFIVIGDDYYSFAEND